MKHIADILRHRSLDTSKIYQDRFRPAGGCRSSLAREGVTAIKTMTEHVAAYLAANAPRRYLRRWARQPFR